MQQRSSLVLLAFLGLAALVACRSSSSAPSVAAAPSAMSQEEAPMDPDALAAKQMELATPSVEHSVLMDMAGTWTTHYRFRWSPDAPWEESSGITKSEPILGGRYLMQNVQWAMMGMPFEGLQILGFDKMSNEYTSIWFDNFSTWSVSSRGKASDDGTLTLVGTMVDVAGARAFRMVLRSKADGTLESEMYDTIPPHGDVQVMSTVSERVP